MFTRSSAGLSNQHIFYGVDLVVYCEGKELDGEAASIDEVFWEHVFIQNGKKVYCKSVGGKPELLALAQRIVDEGLSNIAVAMDKDYDDLRGQLVVHPQVIYTFGYSWESDVIWDFNLDNGLALFVNVPQSNKIAQDFADYFSRQSNALRRVYALDYKYILHPDPLFDRTTPLSIIAFGGNQEPVVKVSTLLARTKALDRFQSGPLPGAVYDKACGMASFYGKAVARMVFHWFVYRTRNIAGVRRVYYDAFINLLARTLDLQDMSKDRNRHYAQAIAAM
jgi:hypothetical protein